MRNSMDVLEIETDRMKLEQRYHNVEQMRIIVTKYTRIMIK